MQISTRATLVTLEFQTISLSATNKLATTKYLGLLHCLHKSCCVNCYCKTVTFQFYLHHVQNTALNENITVLKELEIPSASSMNWETFFTFTRSLFHYEWILSIGNSPFMHSILFFQDVQCSGTDRQTNPTVFDRSPDWV